MSSGLSVCLSQNSSTYSTLAVVSWSGSFFPVGQFVVGQSTFGNSNVTAAALSQQYAFQVNLCGSYFFSAYQYLPGFVPSQQLSIKVLSISPSSSMSVLSTCILSINQNPCSVYVISGGCVVTSPINSPGTSYCFQGYSLSPFFCNAPLGNSDLQFQIIFPSVTPAMVPSASVQINVIGSGASMIPWPTISPLVLPIINECQSLQVMPLRITRYVIGAAVSAKVRAFATQINSPYLLPFPGGALRCSMLNLLSGYL